MVPVFEPMLASTGVPSDRLDAYACEVKLDGWRAVVTVQPGRVTVRTRPGRDISGQVPELAALGELGVEAVLDGELIVGAGKAADFYRVAGALASRDRRSPLTFAAFDLLWLDGRRLTREPYEKRRLWLEQLSLPASTVTVKSWPWQDAARLLRACGELGVEGIVLKRRDSSYLPGRRTDAWRKIKCDRWYAEHAEYRRPRG